MSGYEPDRFRQLIDLSLDAHRFVEAVEAGERVAPDRAVELAKKIDALDPLLSPERRELAETAMSATIAFERGEIDADEKDAIVAESMERSEDLDQQMLDAADELAAILSAHDA